VEDGFNRRDVEDDRSAVLLNHKSNKLWFMASIYGATAGWLLLFLTVGRDP